MHSFAMNYRRLLIKRKQTHFEANKDAETSDVYLHGQIRPYTDRQTAKHTYSNLKDFKM